MAEENTSWSIFTKECYRTWEVSTDWLCWGLTTRQPLRVILCRLPEKGRKKIEEIVEEMKEMNREERGTEMKEWKWRNRRNKNIPPLPLPATRIVGLPQL